MSTRKVPRRASAIIRWLFIGTDDLRVPGPVRDAVRFSERDERLAHYGLQLARRVREFHEGEEEATGYDPMMMALVRFEAAERGPVPRRMIERPEPVESLPLRRRIVSPRRGVTREPAT